MDFKKVFCFSVALSFLMGLVVPYHEAYAKGNGNVTVHIDKKQGTVEDFFNLKVSVEGKIKGKPELPSIKGLYIQFTGSSQQIQMVNGQFSRQTTYSYVLRAKKPGEFVIPPIQVKIGKKIHVTETITLKISDLDQSSLAVGKRDIFLDADLNKTKAYVGEQILYSLRFYRRVQTTAAELDKPDFRGVAVEPLGKQKELTRIFADRRYHVTELNYALFPTREGTIEIPAASISYETIEQDLNDPFQRFGFFSSGRRVRGQVVSRSFQLEVLPLPKKGRPQSFSGLVGQFELDSEISKKSLAVGESTTLTLVLKGKGNVRQMPNLDLKEFDGKMYDDKPSLSIRPTDEGLWGKKIFKKALVPQKEGSLIVPPVTLSYFDPKKEEFVFLKGKIFTLEVQPSEEGEALILMGNQKSPLKKRVQVLGEDLMPVHTKLQALKNDSPSSRMKIFFAGSTLFPPILFFGVWLFIRNKEYRLKNETFIRSVQALKRALRGLKKLDPLIGKNLQDFYAELGKHIRFYLGEKLDIKGQALTAREAYQILLEHGANKIKAQQLEEILMGCEKAQFGKGVSQNLGPFENEKEIWKRTKSLLKHLDREITLQKK